MICDEMIPWMLGSELMGDLGINHVFVSCDNSSDVMCYYSSNAGWL